MSTTEDEVTTGAWPLLRGWWEDKPKPHQNLVIAGAIATVVFLGAGVLLETWLEGWAKNIPSLAGFVWDVAKALLIGTVLFSVIDVLRSWGMSWRVLKVSEDALYQEVGAFLNTVNNYLGLNLVIGVFGGCGSGREGERTTQESSLGLSGVVRIQRRILVEPSARAPRHPWPPQPADMRAADGHI